MGYFAMQFVGTVAMLKRNEYRLKGHESFILRDGWLTKGLIAIHNNPKVFSNNYGADVLGVGTNMAKAIRYWLRAAGLTDETIKGVSLTELGQLIFEKDLYFEDVFSLWIIHVNIARNFKLATSWNIFFNNIGITSFRRDELIRVMTESITNIIGEPQPERTIRDDCAAILQMYADNEENENRYDPEEKKESPFAALGLVTIPEKGLYEKSKPRVKAVSQLSMVVLYMISDKFQEEKSIQIDDIVFAPNMVGKILNVNRLVVNDILDILQNQGFIIINRTAGLDVVYPGKMISPIEAVRLHYEGKA